MAFIKTEVNTDLDKKVAGKGVDYIAKELENIRADYSKKINLILILLTFANTQLLF